MANVQNGLQKAKTLRGKSFARSPVTEDSTVQEVIIKYDGFRNKLDKINTNLEN